MAAIAGTGIVVVDRVGAWMGGLRGLPVYVDGRKVASVKNASTAQFEIDPGQHAIQVRMGLMRSNIETFDIQAGEIAHFECGIDTYSWQKRLLAFLPWKTETLYLIPVTDEITN